jgi:hypothetical protein
MTADIAVVIPTLRPQRAAPLAENLARATNASCALYFVVEPHDAATIAAVEEAGFEPIINEGAGNYASCINTAFRRTTEPFLFIGADDIEFVEGCFEAGLASMVDDGVGVVGANDPEHVKGDHADHYMIRRRYIDQFGGSFDPEVLVLYEYQHAFTDVEIISVAKIRGAYRFDPAFDVIHHHPGWVFRAGVNESSPLYDEVYRKGNEGFAEDVATFAQRSRPWRRALLARPDVSQADKWYMHVARMNDERVRPAYLKRLLHEIDVENLEPQPPEPSDASS